MLSLACLDRITLFRKVDHAYGSRKGKGFGFDGNDCMTHMNPSPIAPFNERQCIRVDQSPSRRNKSVPSHVIFSCLYHSSINMRWVWLGMAPTHSWFPRRSSLSVVRTSRRRRSSREVLCVVHLPPSSSRFGNPLPLLL